MTPLLDWSHYAPRLRYLREAQMRTQAGLARELDLTESMVQSLERGRRTPSMGTFLALCRALGVTPAYFFEERP